jgi:hypothetical protein
VINTIEDGVMTKDLAICVHGSRAGPDTYVYTQDFMDAIKGEPGFGWLVAWLVAVCWAGGREGEGRAAAG